MEDRDPRIWVVFDLESDNLKNDELNPHRVSEYARYRIIAIEDTDPELLFHNSFGPYIVYHEGSDGIYTEDGKRGQLMIDKAEAFSSGNWQPFFNKYKLDWTYAVPRRGTIEYKAWLSGYRVFIELMDGRHKILAKIKEAEHDLVNLKPSEA